MANRISVTKRNNFKLTVLLGAVGYFVAFIIIGLATLIRVNWDPSIFHTAGFWTRILTYPLAYLIVYISTFFILYEKLGFDEKFRKIENFIFLSKPYLIVERFRIYIAKLDYKNKKETWIEIINALISNLNNKITLKIQEEIEKLPKKQWSRRTIRWKKRLDKLELQLTDKWIDKNLKYTKLKYPAITTAEVISGSTKIKTKSHMIETGYVRRNILLKSVTIIFSVVFVILWAGLNKSGFNDIFVLITDIILSIVLIFANIVTAVIAARDSHRHRLSAADDRLGVTITYLGELNVDIDEIDREAQIQTDKFDIDEMERIKKSQEIKDLKKQMKKLEKLE